MRVPSLPLAALVASALLAGCGAQSGLPSAGSASGPWTPAASRAASALGPFSASAYLTELRKTKPVVYFSLDDRQSAIGKYGISLVGGARFKSGGAIKSQPHDKSLLLHGTAYATTTFTGRIPGAGAMVAWVNLSELPSQAGQYFYISGESQSGNDFDLQFENDNNLYFYTGGGENTEYTTNAADLLHRWIMVAVSYEGGPNGFRDIYWNGRLVAPYHGQVDNSPKTSQFNIGESLVFTGRYFQGAIDAVAVWNHPLNAKQIKAIYQSAR